MPARLLFLGYGLDGASWRFRVAQYLPHLRARGIEVETADLHGPLGRRLRALRAAADRDAVCVHRALLSPIERRWLRRVAPRYVFDFDDAVMLRDSAAPRSDAWQRRRRFAGMVRGAGTVVAGNAYLADWARRYRADATIIPSPVDLAEYPPRRDEPSPPIVGWMGTASNLMYLRAIVPALTRLCAQRPETRIKVVCDADFAAAGLPLIATRWSRSDEAADLHSFQVGIMPLPDDPWTRGKCAVKILQYFAAGVPVVCSPVGANLDVVEHGRSGYFATTPDEWVARLDELLANPVLRRSFGAHGRATVQRRFSVEAVLPQLLDVLRR